MIHVGAQPFPFNPHECEMHLLADFMVSFVDEVELLLEHVPVMLYSGQLDIIIGAATTEKFLADLEWGGAAAFAAAQRSVWRLSPSVRLPDTMHTSRQGAPFSHPLVCLRPCVSFLTKTA